MTAAYDDSNIFAKILRDEIPSVRVYEDENCIAFMDVMPQTAGHTLIVPRAPSRNLLDADPNVLSKVIPVVQKIAQAAMKAFNADGIQLRQFNEAPSGQTVYHLHFHIIPVYAGVEFQMHAAKMEDMDILKANAEKLKAAL
ncbi:HIT family protein [Rhizobium sp. L1K21]|uniref:HIT family protein n=1 Tax=Rhizobium sp. L1K21 TaxID=2954933 RepID=UPI0020931D52|nr:HIT family protein [Rhizobium sp. L1K21]MCO6185981.1 HIT family protein [Rhizobium sp. L1K21]